MGREWEARGGGWGYRMGCGFRWAGLYGRGRGQQREPMGGTSGAVGCALGAIGCHWV